jgi:hypothetical protein
MQSDLRSVALRNKLHGQLVHHGVWKGDVGIRVVCNIKYDLDVLRNDRDNFTNK